MSETKYTVVSINRFSGDNQRLQISNVTVGYGRTIEDYLRIAGKKTSDVIIFEGKPSVVKIHDEVK